MEQKYQKLKQVGEGSFGQVFKARRKYDGATVAYKVTRKKGRTKKELESLRRECEIQKDVNHPNIIQMLDSFETDNEIVVVTEYVEKELYEIIEKSGPMCEERAQVIACDLVSALHYLHSKRIVHRDMKPQNVLLDTNGVAKLCDFGFARLMSLGTHVLMSIKGTPLYMAPELIYGVPYDHNVDLWSLGCIVYELVKGAPPFQTSSMVHLIELIRHKDIEWPEHMSTSCIGFLQGLLQKDPSQRLTWPELLEHPFVKGRILTVGEDAPRALTSPLSASQAMAKQQQLQSLASRFTSQSKKILEKQIKKIHSQVLRRSEPSGSESSASVDVLLNNLSLRASLRSDLVNADYAICPQIDCPIAEEDQPQQFAQPKQLDSFEAGAECFVNANIPDNPMKNIMERRTRLADWCPRDSEQPIENEEWVVFLQRSMEEAMEGEVGEFLQKNCVSVFASPLMNPGASCKVIEYAACLVSLPFVLSCLSADDLERIQMVYLDVRLVPHLVYAVKLLLSDRFCGTETEGSTSTANHRWRSNLVLSADELQALESTVLVLCRLVHEKQEFLLQFCDAAFVIPDGLLNFQQLLGLDRRKVRVVTDMLAILSQVLRSQSANTEIVDGILMKSKSTDQVTDLFSKFMTHKTNKLLRSQACTLLTLLGKHNQKTLQRIWGKSMRDILENLVQDREKTVREAASETLVALKSLTFYHQDKDCWTAIET